MKNVRKTLVAVVVTSVLALLVGVSGSAQGPEGIWTSWPFIQNLESGATTCSIAFFEEDAATADPVYVLPFNVPGDSSKLVPVWSLDTELGASFSGSMVVSCDGRVAAVTNVVNGAGAGSSYVGADAGDNTVSIPSVHANDWGWFTEVSVQNTGAIDAVVTVAFKASERGQNYTPPSVTIKPGSVHRFNTYDYRSIMDNVSGDPGFVGGASVTSTGGKVVAVAREWNSGPGTMTITYNGIPSTEGGTTLYFPSQHNNNWGWYSWNFIFNNSDKNLDVKIQFTGQAEQTAQVPANGSLTIATQDYLGSTDYVGALTVTCDGDPDCTGIPLSGITNEVNSGTKGAISYNGFFQGSTSILFPAQHNNNWGWNAFNFVQNLDDAVAHVTVEWVAGPGSPSPAPASFDTTIPANGKLELHTYNYHGASDFVGSLRVSVDTGQSPDARIVGICNEVNGGVSNMDASISYNSLFE